VTICSLVVCFASTVRADDTTNVKIASRWLDAARAGNTKQLVALSSPTLIVQDVVVDVSPRCGASFHSRRAVVRAVRQMVRLFADDASFENVRGASSKAIQVCPRRGGTGRGRVLEARRGDVDVELAGKIGTRIMVRVARSGKVVAVQRWTYVGDQ
jgi:hypothetical protein